MYKQEIQHRLITEIRNDFPYMKIGVRFSDYFTQDTYIFESSNRKNNLKYIPFSIYRNDELIKECALIDNNIDEFLENVFEDINDHDLKRLFYSQLKGKITREVEEFLELYDKVVLVTEVTLEGEMRRMKQIAGITNKNLMN